MRNMSFSLTTPQVRAGTKTVTRRRGWWFLKPGDLLMAIEKGQGLKKGEHVVRIRPIRVVNARPEPLFRITKSDCRREGFPHLTPRLFVMMFCEHNGCHKSEEINRILFEYVKLCTCCGGERRGYFGENPRRRTTCPKCQGSGVSTPQGDDIPF